MATTAKGVPYVESADALTDYPTVSLSLATLLDGRPGVAPLTTTERDALSGANRWTGRTIFNTTKGELETWNGSSWVGHLRLTGGVLLGDVALHSYRERATSTSTSTMTVDFTGHQLQATTVSGALTVAWSNLPSAGQVRSVTMKMGSNVGAVTWPSGTKFAGGVQPTLDGLSYLVAFAEGTTVTVFESGMAVA